MIPVILSKGNTVRCCSGGEGGEGWRDFICRSSSVRTTSNCWTCCFKYMQALVPFDTERQTDLFIFIIIFYKGTNQDIKYPNQIEG